MSDLYTLKEAIAAKNPVLCFEFSFWDGHVERFSTHEVSVDGMDYARRVVDRELHDASLGSEDAISYYSRIGVTLDNADGLLTQIERTHGFRGATVTVRLVFGDLSTGEILSEPITVFRGTADSPSILDEARAVVRAESRFSLFRSKLPRTPIQRRCPWHFPQDAAARLEAANGATEGTHSLVHRCGYSPDQAGGAGNLQGGTPFTACRGTREDCAARGMLDKDSAGRETRRFGGFTYLPPSIQVRTHGSRSLQTGEVHANHPRGNDVVPLVYGQGWLTPPLIHSRNDGNLTRMLYLLCDGEVENVERVIVNSVEIPAAVQGRDMTPTGWHKIIAPGSRNGGLLPKPDDDGYYAESDPHGSMATLEVVIPNALQKGNGQPTTEVLVKGLRLLTYSAVGAFAGRVHSSNPAWVLLDVLLRSGCLLHEIDLPSFAAAALYCDEPVQATLWSGMTQMQPRFSCNLVLQKRRGVSEILRGLREGSFLFLRENFEGKLEAVVESTIAAQQPTKGALSNANSPLNGGWPVYEFGDGAEGRGGILRRSNGSPSFQLRARPQTESGNRVYAEFQDAWNEFQTDRISLFDSSDIRRGRQEIAQHSRAMGLSTFPQAARALHVLLKRNTSGNRYVEFETGLKGIGVRPGDLITVSYPKYGLDREMFRVLRVSPGANLETSRIVAQWHEDSWYMDSVLDEIGGVDSFRRAGSGYGVPRPLLGAVLLSDGYTQFQMEEGAEVVSDGKYRITLKAGFIEPARKTSMDLAAPISAMTAMVVPGAGTLPPGETYYYRLTSVGVDGLESAASKAVKVNLPGTGAGFAAQLTGIVSPNGASGLRVYRGKTIDSVLAIAELPPSETTFTDHGAAPQPVVIADPNFDHANFYWRQEVHPAIPVSFANSESVGNSSADWQEDQFQGKLVSITGGKGKGQERTIQSNNSNTLFVEPWAVVPDLTSEFAIAEATWQLACKSKGSPAVFEIPNKAGSIVQVLGVAANGLDEESPVDRATITRWQIGGGSMTPVDADVPPTPFFALTADGAGELVLSGIGFETLENTRTVQSGTLELFSYDELRELPTAGLVSAVGESAESLEFDVEPGLAEGDHFQLGREILRVSAVTAGGAITALRGQLGTVPETHGVGDRPYLLGRGSFVFPVPLHFFGSEASGTFRHGFHLPHSRVAAARLWFTNTVGESPSREVVYTGLEGAGLRTGYGGQYSLYVEGYLAIENDAAIPLIVDRDHSVRDVFATLEAPPTGGDVVVDITVDQAVYCTLTISQGQEFSNIISGVNLAPLRAGSRVGIDVRSVVHYGNTTPGRDLSVRIRL